MKAFLYGALPLLTVAAVASGLLADAREVMGKVVAVYHEPVVVNSKSFDKVSVTVELCGAPSRQFLTAAYAPGFVSDENSMGYLYNHLANAARSSVQKNQYMNIVSGHVSLLLNDQTKQIEKTTFWGYNWECGKNIDGSAGASSGASNSSGTTAAPASSASPAPKGFGGRKFGF